MLIRTTIPGEVCVNIGSYNDNMGLYGSNGGYLGVTSLPHFVPGGCNQQGGFGDGFQAL